MEATIDSSAIDDSGRHIFQQLDTYPWDRDAEFQSGLHAILGASPSSEQIEHLTLRARCFYYSRYTLPMEHRAYLPT